MEGFLEERNQKDGSSDSILQISSVQDVLAICWLPAGEGQLMTLSGSWKNPFTIFQISPHHWIWRKQNSLSQTDLYTTSVLHPTAISIWFQILKFNRYRSFLHSTWRQVQILYIENVPTFVFLKCKAMEDDGEHFVIHSWVDCGGSDKINPGLLFKVEVFFYASNLWVWVLSCASQLLLSAKGQMMN